jgi:hypothetical protein
MKLLDLDPVVRGLAVWDGAAWRFGAEALAACRVDPQATCWDVWEAMSLIPLAGKRGGVRHRADLAVRMLEGGGEPCVALVPSAWEKEEMRVFLGAAAAAKVSVRWLTSRAGAVATRAQIDGEACSVLEWSWNRLQQVNFVRGTEGEWKRESVVSFPDAGILACFQREALAVQDLALDKFRFDPLYSGRTEQALFSGWWQALNEGVDWSVVSPGGGKIELSPERSRFAELHAKVLNGLSDDPSLIVPPAFRRMLGWTRATPEPPLGQDVDVEDHDVPAARWRESLTLSGTVGLRATHVVIEGIAEPWSGDAAPGETVMLPDGRTALAVHVRERYGAA